MKKFQKNSPEYLEELEEKIVDLSFQLKNKGSELNTICQSHRKLIRKLTHNLKNPVGVILSFSEIMLEDIEYYSADKLEKHISIIKNSADYSVQFLNETMKFSRLLSPDVSFLFKKLNYIDLLNQIVNQFEPFASEKKITIKRDFNAAGSILLIDEGEMTQAISNILNNAVRFSFENTTITVSVRESEDHLETVITDNGIGVSAEDLPEIFKEYYVVNTFSNNSKKCIGLGLTMAKKIIQRHKGSISFTSILDQGSSVKITLPKNDCLN